MNVALTFGQLMSCIIAGLLSTTDEGWRYMLGIAAIPAIIQLLGVALFLESPRYLFQEGQERSVPWRTKGPADVNDEIRDIMRAVVDEQEAIIREIAQSLYTLVGDEEEDAETEM